MRPSCFRAILSVVKKPSMRARCRAGVLTVEGVFRGDAVRAVDRRWGHRRDRATDSQTSL